MALRRAILLAAFPIACLLQACSAAQPEDGAARESAAAPDSAASAPASGSAGFEPGASLAFEWSANGFEQLPAQYTWTGSGKRDDVFQPNLSLSVPETDDVVWSSSCEADGRVMTQIYFAAPKAMKNGRATFRFETDTSTKTLEYQVKHNPSGQYEGFDLVLSADDPMFADMQSGAWAYVQIGEGSDAIKQRISLAGAAKSLRQFLPACKSGKPQVAAAPQPSATVYHCKDGRTARATYLGNDTDNPVVRLEIGGAVYLLSQVVSGSGARYDNSHDKAGDKRRTWHNKGAGSLLIESAWEDADGVTETIVHCAEPS